MPQFYIFIAIIFQLLIGKISSQCWFSSYGRGVGRALNSCPNGYEKNGALCYPLCKSGYYGNGPICWSSCQTDYINTGLTCFKGSHVFGKGCCCIKTIFSNNNCCDNCPTGYNDDGCTCHRYPHSYPRDSYPRGVGIPLECSANEEKNGALCYPLCKNGFKGIGPICWIDGCKGSMSYTCGLMCTTNKIQCDNILKNFALTGLDLITNLIFNGLGNPFNFLSLFSTASGISYQLINDG